MTLLQDLRKTSRKLSKRFPPLRYASIWTVLLTLGWLFLLYRGERTLYRSHVAACAWDAWENWPRDAVPHRLALVADPQLVDPHTYPGRPWPLSALTESYTDLYMARNFRLINQRLDPDSVVLLGDLLDGAREWAPAATLPLTPKQESFRRLFWTERAEREEEAKKKASEEASGHGITQSRGEELDNTLVRHQPEPAMTERQTQSPGDVNERKSFLYGENGRWKPWAGRKQWNYETDRFARIFFSDEQLYPHHDRSFVETLEAPPLAINLDNGSPNETAELFATSGRKLRRILTSLPGNHDLGFGHGVQLSVRDRYTARYGDPNSVTVLGNHTFVSLDTPSLSAYSEYLETGSETSVEQRSKLSPLWQPTADFLNNLSSPVSRAVNETLDYYYPGSHAIPGLEHTVSELQTAGQVQRHIDATRESFPVVLLTHIPLFRNPDIDCGPDRENGHNLPVTFGYQYQTVVTSTLSTDIIKQITTAGGAITHIFSGDDHDYCNVTHHFTLDDTTPLPPLLSIPEITVKSFSWAMGVRKPGFQLVSMWNPVDAHGRSLSPTSPTIQTHLCLLPDQLSIFISYGIFCAITLLTLLLHATIKTYLSPSHPSRHEYIHLDQDELDSLDPDSDDESPLPALPQFRPRVSPPPEHSNGYSSSSRSHSQDSKGRQRASSTSTSSFVSSTLALGVQRSYNARTRSVSPGVPNPSSIPPPPPSDPTPSFPHPSQPAPASRTPPPPLPPPQSTHPPFQPFHPFPNTTSTQSLDYTSLDLRDAQRDWTHDGDDSQAKFKRRRRLPIWLRRFLVEFAAATAWVALPSGAFYVVLVRSG